MSYVPLLLVVCVFHLGVLTTCCILTSFVSFISSYPNLLEPTFLHAQCAHARLQVLSKYSKVLVFLIFQFYCLKESVAHLIRFETVTV